MRKPPVRSIDSSGGSRDMPRVTELFMRALLMAFLANTAPGTMSGQDRARARFAKTTAKKTTTTV
jgi:hypothetical protein